MSERASYSPPPWKWKEQLDVDELPVLLDANGAEVCNFGSDASYDACAGNPPNEADKRLIEAAPELLVALESACARVIMHVDHHSSLPEWAALIARVKGEP